MFRSHRHLRIAAAHRTPPIDPFQQHRQLCGCQRHRSAGRLRPNESSALQSFCEQTQPVAVPPQQFDQIPSPPAEHEHLSRKRIVLQRRLHHPTQARKSTSQIGYSCGDPDPRSCRQPDHPTKHSIAARSAATSTIPAIRTVPRESLISKVPDRGRKSSSFTASADRAFATFTGRSLAAVSPPSCPSR